MKERLWLIIRLKKCLCTTNVDRATSVRKTYASTKLIVVSARDNVETQSGEKSRGRCPRLVYVGPESLLQLIVVTFVIRRRAGLGPSGQLLLRLVAQID